MNETIEQCAVRELQEETGICASEENLTMVGVFSRVDRDPRGRTVSVAFMLRVNKEEAVAADDAEAAEWWSIDNLPPLAFDHEEILLRVKRLIGKD